MPPAAIPETERAMVKATERQLLEHDRRYAVEVPLFHRSIDMVWEDPHESDQLVAVEFKLQDWKQALRQARDHLLGADRVYITLPAPRIHEAIIQKAQTTGVGVMGWEPDGRLEIQLPFEPNDLLWEPIRDQLRETFRWRIRTMKERGEYRDPVAGSGEEGTC